MSCDLEKILFLKKKAAKIRLDVIDLVYTAKTGHTGSSLSDVEILTILFNYVMKYDPENPKWDGRDRFILSKGHAVESYFCMLADCGFFPQSELKTFSAFGSKYIGHPNNKVAGVEMNTGALGHGLSVSVGMALAAKMDGKSHRIFTLMGDGEQAEGSVWEAAMAASHYRLDNIVAIIDRNKLQISGTTEDVMGLEPLGERWESFGWHVLAVDGHDIEKLCDAFDTSLKVKGKPTLIIANTIKGKGVSFMENTAKWHHGVPNDEQYKQASEELKAELERMSLYE